MSHEEQRPAGDEVPQQGEPEVNTSGSAAAAEDLTVEDILAAAPNAAAKQQDAAEQSAPASDTADSAAAGAAEPAADGAADSAAGDSAQANVYLEDLRRLTAEYANYRKRTEENAELEKQRAAARVITPLLAILDDFERAAKHGDLPEGSAVAAIAQKLQDTLSRQGLEKFGAVGEEFDPQIHEAIAQVPAPGAEPNTVLDVVEYGYRLGAVELRPAKVAVAVAQDG
ncbi:nucleotide exchange factor GrpE [Canibacter oris]|uniref:Protein GrpE n=1 Tax=Canibacter oris TaxID=1365628 RepID=A0A840DLX1_9MICO|nr:nucleotide exchange factor GrpE [Canibacter oris]MBB4071068.1 molecular chaperone GrpE [Canibacter oris]